jgi:peptidoglycan/LPS O-acetylase OafA/YrhL
MASRPGSLWPLTSLRFFAALAVFALHTSIYCRGNDPTRSPAALHLATGVTFFFVLSGFILTYNYLDWFQHPTARGIWNFYVARWARIWPLHLLALAAMIPITGRLLLRGSFGPPLGKTVANLALVHAFASDPAWHTPFNVPSWSLSAEWFFYLCFPLLIRGLTTGSPRRRAAVLLLVLAPWLTCLARLAGLTRFGQTVDPYSFPPTRLVDFLAGVLLGLFWHRRQSVPVAIDRGPTFRASLAEGGAVLALAAWAWLWTRIAPSAAASYACNWAGPYLPVFVLCIGVFARGDGFLSRVLSARPLVYLGEISFAVYMLHMPVLYYLAVYGHVLGIDRFRWGWKALLAAATTLVLSAACHRFYELPLRDWLKRRLSVRGPRCVGVSLPTPARLTERRVA